KRSTISAAGAVPRWNNTSKRTPFRPSKPIANKMLQGPSFWGRSPRVRGQNGRPQLLALQGFYQPVTSDFFSSFVLTIGEDRVWIHNLRISRRIGHERAGLVASVIPGQFRGSPAVGQASGSRKPTSRPAARSRGGESCRSRTLYEQGREDQRVEAGNPGQSP